MDDALQHFGQDYADATPLLKIMRDQHVNGLNDASIDNIKPSARYLRTGSTYLDVPAAVNV